MEVILYLPWASNLIRNASGNSLMMLVEITSILLEWSLAITEVEVINVNNTRNPIMVAVMYFLVLVISLLVS